MPWIEGTERTRTLITNIARDFHSKKPSTRHVDYSIKTGWNSELLTDEQGDVFRNVSIIYLPGINAAIGNKTGNMLIGKPWFMSIKKAVRKICDFLEKIQPEKLSTAKVVESESSYTWHNPMTSGPTPDFSKFVEILDVNGTKVQRTITGNNHLWSSDCLDAYKTL